MVAPLVAAAGIGAVSSLVGGATGGKGADKAAKAQLKAQREQIAAAKENRDYQYSLNAPAITYGGAADDTIAGLLNIGGDAAASGAAFDQYRDSTGYGFRLAQGEGAINSNAYARGMGDSGATLKALQSYGQNIASDEFGKYLGQLGGVSATGANARGLVAGVGNQTVNTMNQATQAGADATGNAALVASGGWANALQQAGLAAASAYGSSYRAPINVYNNPDYRYG